MFEWYMARAVVRLVDTKKTCYDEIGTVCTNYSNHPRFNIEHNLGGPK